MNFKATLFFHILLLLSVCSKAQPGGYVPGQLWCWPYNGLDHGYFTSVGWDANTDHVLIFFGGAGQTTCNQTNYPNIGNIDDMDPGQILNQSVGAWNGITNGGGVRWKVLIIRDFGNNPANYAADIATFFETATGGMDTAEHHRIHIGGGSAGVGNAIGWLQNTSVGSGNPYRKIFSTAIWMSGTLPTINSDYPVPYNMLWYGTADTNPGTPPSFTIQLYNDIPGVPNATKHLKWTVGGTHSNSTWGDVYNVAGTDSSANRWIWMVEQPNYVPPIPENKITGIVFQDLIDEAGGSGNPYTFFDEQLTADPENGVSPACSSLSLPNSDIYYPKMWGRQWRSAVDLRANYHLKKIWYYVAFNNDLFDDTLFLFKTNDFVTFEKMDSIRVPINTATGWYSKVLDDTTRYVVYGLKRRQNPTFLSWGSPYVYETILYGDLISGQVRRPTPPLQYAGIKRPKQTMGSLLGENLIGGYEPMHNLSDFAHMRVMNDRHYPDDSLGSLALGTKKFNGDHFNEIQGGAPWRAMRYLWDSINTITGFVLPEFNASSYKVNTQAGSQICWAYNDFGDDPLLVSSYTESGYLAWNMAAQFGHIQVDSNRLRIYRAPRNTGLNLDMHFTFGSEINRFWGVIDTATSGCRYTPNLMYLYQSQNDYDGYQDSFGDSIGIKNADPLALLGAAADYKIDSMMIQSRVKISRAMRTDSANIFGSFQFNEYPDKQYTGDVRSMHAVEYGMSSHVNKIIDVSYRLDPDMLVMLTENGMDANQGSDKATPQRTGTTWTDREWQAINLGWNIIEVSKTNIDKYFLYVMVTNSAENNAGTFQTSDIMSSFPDIIYKPPYYYIRNMVRTMRNFRHESTIQSSWRGLCIEKYRHATISDSVAYVVGYADTTGITLSNQIIPMIGVIGNGTKVELSFTSFTNTQTPVTVLGGLATMSVGEKPFVILASEQAPVDRRNYFRGSIRRNKFRN
jgi:hypothetical protein